MAGICFNCFRSGRSKNYHANQTIVTCQRTFAYGLEEINIAQQNLRTIYDAVIAGVRGNQVKLQLTEEFVEKLCDELSSLGCISEKLNEQIEKDEKHLAERQKAVSEISADIRNCRLSLDHMKEQIGFNEWIARNKDSICSTQNISPERKAIEKELYMLMSKSNGLSEAQYEIDAEIERLQVIRETYSDAHNEDIEDFKAKLDMALQNKKLLALEAMKKPQEIVSMFSSNVNKLENMRDELVKFRDMRRLRELEIQSLRVEEDTLNEGNAELMYRVIHIREELVKLKGEKGTANLPIAMQLPQGATIIAVEPN